MITLTIDSVDSLPDGGPIQFQARSRGFEIGRQQHLDWTLPDPSRFISGLHCEVRFEKGVYWLYDVSRNGTFLNGSSARMKSPYRLTTGDRLTIGHYIVRVEVEDSGAQVSDEFQADDPSQRAFSTPSDDIWSTGDPAPPPIDRRELIPEPANRRRAADFSHQFLEFPDMRPPVSGEAPAFRGEPLPVAPGPMPAEIRHDISPAFPAQAPGNANYQPPPAFQPVPEPVVRQQHPIQGDSFGQPSGPAGGSVPSPFSAQPIPQPRAAPVGMGQQAPNPFLHGLATGAGVAPDTFLSRDPAEVGYEIGEFLRVTTEHLAQLLRARAAAKAMTKSASRTMIGATDNNPLKFIPGAPEAIDVMFSRRRPGFLGSKASIDAAFADLKRHELATYTAMQKALDRLLEELSPETITAKVGNSAFSKKSRSWELFVERWEQKSGPHDNGMLDVFFSYFAEAYDEANKKG